MNPALPSLHTFRHIAVIQTAFVGDVALVLYLMQTLHALHPQARLTLVTTPLGAELAQYVPSIHHVIPFDKRKRQRGLSGLQSIAEQLRSAQVECILAPHRSLRTTLITRMARPQWSVGFRKNSASWLYHHRVPYPAVHEAERNLSLIEGMAEIPVRAVQPVLAIPDDILDRSHHTLTLIQGEETLPVIALAPGSVWATKRYSLRHIQHIAQELLNRYHVVLVGGPDDMGLCKAIEDHVRSAPRHLLLRGRITNLCGATSLIELIALLRHCSAILTNDSAPTHLANIAGCRVVSVFGPTVPSFGFAPRGDDDHVVERTDLPCRPCSSHGSRKCPLEHHACMEGIDPERIVEILQQR